MQTENGQGKSLPMVRLISADTVTDVTAFYMQQISTLENSYYDKSL
jgi:hypothetical protein